MFFFQGVYEWKAKIDAKCKLQIAGCFTKNIKCFDTSSSIYVNNNNCSRGGKPKYLPCADSECPALTTDTDPKYMGCYADYHHRLFNYIITTDGPLFTKSTCATKCKGFTHYGVQFFGAECFCGLEHESYKSQGLSKGCTNKQGGWWSIDVWEVNSNSGKNNFFFSRAIFFFSLFICVIMM
jgi:hypothetical protein